MLIINEPPLKAGAHFFMALHFLKDALLFLNQKH